MPRRLVALFSVLVVCTASSAETPLALAELEVQRAIAQAEAAAADAESDLAAWKLGQLQQLNRKGHASWQEVAEQEVVATSAAARAKASQRYLQSVIDLEALVSDQANPGSEANSGSEANPGPASECIRLFLPGSARLVAWIPTDVATPALLKQHLATLLGEHQSVSQIDLAPLENAIEKAEKAVAVYRRIDDPELYRRAEIQLQWKRAEYEMARARKNSTDVIARRIALVKHSLQQLEFAAIEPSPALAQAGTRFVSATGNDALRHAVTTMSGQTVTSQQILWLKHQFNQASDRVNVLQELSEQGHADQDEREAANQRKTDLEIAISRAEELLAIHRVSRAALAPDRSDETAANVEPVVNFDDPSFWDANFVRHWLQTQQQKLNAEADQAGVKAEYDYLSERLKRVERIPENSRPPKELDQMRHRIRGVELQLAIVRGQAALLDRERERLREQIASQAGEPYQLVQADNGQFVSRQQFELAGALVAAIGFVGDADLFPGRTTLYPYIESPAILDCLASLSDRLPYATTSRFRCSVPALSIYHFRRCGTRSVSSGLQLASPGITYPRDLFCYAPLQLIDVHPYYRWAGRYQLRNVAYGHSFYAFDNGVIGSSRMRLSLYRDCLTTRSSFPYLSGYAYQSVFPVRNELGRSPYRRLSSELGGYGLSSGLGYRYVD